MMLYDYIIVGNAILGLTTAYRLTQLAPQATLCILGPAGRPDSATAAAGAMLGLFGEVTAAQSAEPLDQAYFQLAYHAQTIWPDFVDELTRQLDGQDAVQIHPNGTFILHSQQSAQHRDTRNYQAILSALRTYQEPHTEVTPGDIPGLSPAECDIVRGGVYIPRERSIQPMTVLAALETILGRNPQVTYQDATVTQLLTEPHNQHRIRGVLLDNGEQVIADQVVLAAGVGTQAILDALPVLNGCIPHIMAGDGVSFVMDQTPMGTHTIEHVIRTPNRAGAYGLHLVPNVQQPTLLYLGASNVLRWRPVSGASEKQAQQIKQESAHEISTWLKQAKILAVQQGQRPTPIDGYPLFGACTGVAGLWLLTGTGRDGFQRAPLLSWHIARQMTGDTHYSLAETHTLAAFAAFTPERKPLQTMPQTAVLYGDATSAE